VSVVLRRRIESNVMWVRSVLRRSGGSLAHAGFPDGLFGIDH
jgi:hypothetical protein